MTRDEAIERMERAVRELFPELAEEILDALQLPRKPSTLELGVKMAAATLHNAASFRLAEAIARSRADGSGRAWAPAIARVRKKKRRRETRRTR